MEQEGGEYVITHDGDWKFLREGASTPQTVPCTPASTPAVTPAPTPAPPPAPTPVPSPAVSPQRHSGAVAKRQREEREKDPGLVLIAQTEVELPYLNNQQLKKEVLKGNIVKYVYTIARYHPDIIKKNLLSWKYELTRVRRIYLAYEHYHQIKTGGIYKLDQLEKLQRK